MAFLAHAHHMKTTIHKQNNKQNKTINKNINQINNKQTNWIKQCQSGQKIKADKQPMPFLARAHHIMRMERYFQNGI